MPLIGHIIVLDRPGLALQFRYFDETEMSVGAEWTKQGVRGRAEPYQFYGSTGARAWPWKITFWAGVEAGDETTPTDVLSSVRFLERLQYPILENDLQKDPPRVQMRVGSFLDATGLVKDVKPAWKLPLDYETGLYHGAEVTFTFEEVLDEPLHFDSDIFIKRVL